MAQEFAFTLDMYKKMMADVRSVRHFAPNERPIETVPTPWNPGRILYLKIKRNPNSTGSLFIYDDTVSGYYALGSGVDDFVDARRTAPPDPQTRLDPVKDVNGLDFTLEYKSYIVMQLDPNGNSRFVNDRDGAGVDDVTPAEYVNIWQMRDAGGDPILARGIVPIPDTPEPLPGEQCHIVVFSAKSPSRNGRKVPAVSDNFNLHIQTQNSPGGSWAESTIDPEIKNTGHTT